MPSERQRGTTVKVSAETVEALYKLKRCGEPLDAVIARIVAAYQEEVVPA